MYIKSHNCYTEFYGDRIWSHQSVFMASLAYVLGSLLVNLQELHELLEIESGLTASKVKNTAIFLQSQFLNF